VKVKVVLLFFILSLLIATSAQFQGMRKDKASMEKEAIADSPGGSGRDRTRFANGREEPLSLCTPYFVGKQ
jgi:hypothetical protein